MSRAKPHSRVAVLGASTNPERYSFKAVGLLKEKGHVPVPVHPSEHVVQGIQALPSLEDVTEPVDTLSVYVNQEISSGELDRILKLKPRRVVFNPGTENAPVAARLRDAGIEVVEMCTLVLLRTGQF